MGARWFRVREREAGCKLRTASLAVKHGASALVLASRSGKIARDGQGLADQLKAIQKTKTMFEMFDYIEGVRCLEDLYVH